MTFTIFTTPSLKRHPVDCYVTLGGGGVVKIATARHHGRVSESKSSDEISSSSDESLSTDAGHLSHKPYMHEPPATPSTLRKVDKS